VEFTTKGTWVSYDEEASVATRDDPYAISLPTRRDTDSSQQTDSTVNDEFYYHAGEGM
jgi:hypothetical protein